MQQRLSGRQKAAILLITLGTDLSGKVLRNLKDTEVERLTREVMAMEKVSEEMKLDIVKEAYSIALSRNFLTSGGAQYARQMLVNGLGEQQAEEIWERLGPLRHNQRFGFLKEVDPSQLTAFLQGEQPQTIAFLLSYLSPSLASSVLTSFSSELQTDVALRIATMDRTSPDTIEKMEEVLRAKLATALSQEFSAVGGAAFLVKLLNTVDRGTERRILESIDAADPELAAEVRKLMFTFDDLMLLDDRSMQRLLRDLDSKDLVLALKGANEELRTHVFKNQSTRAAEMLKEELEILGPVRLRNIEEAQQRIANTARRLEEAEEIVIAGQGGDIVV